MLVMLYSICYCNISAAPAARRVVKRSTITIKTEPFALMEIENHAILFSWSTWLEHRWRARASNDDDDDVVQHGGHTSAKTKSCSLGLQHVSLILGIGYGQLTPARTGNPLTSVTLPYFGSGLEVMAVMFSENLQFMQTRKQVKIFGL